VSPRERRISNRRRRESMDFVADCLADGRKLDDFSRECLAIEVDT
jgi:hypothetical protein